MALLTILGVPEIMEKRRVHESFRRAQRFANTIAAGSGMNSCCLRKWNFDGWQWNNDSPEIIGMWNGHDKMIDTSSHHEHSHLFRQVFRVGKKFEGSPTWRYVKGNWDISASLKNCQSLLQLFWFRDGQKLGQKHGYLLPKHPVFFKVGRVVYIQRSSWSWRSPTRN